MKKKVIINFCFLCLGIVIGTFVSLSVVDNKSRKESKYNKVEKFIEFGDTFPIDRFKDINGKKIQVNDSQSKIVFYIDPYCNSCIEKLKTVEHAYGIFKELSIEVAVLWRQIPKDKAMANIPKENQYVVEEYGIVNDYPMFFLLDVDNKVNLIADDVLKVINKLNENEDITKEKMITASNKYIKKNNNITNGGKKCLIYFVMDGCPDCEEADEILSSEVIKEKYQLLTIYTKESFGEKKLVDTDDLFQNLYGIDWYPSFIIIDQEDYKFIGKETIEKLEQKLIE
ncbi:MAG: hypothetical protein RR444_03850 [Oscillospiraceae bacterium]